MAEVENRVGKAVTRMPIRSVLAGNAGTLALTLAYATERRIRRGHRGQLRRAAARHGGRRPSQ